MRLSLPTTIISLTAIVLGAFAPARVAAAGAKRMHSPLKIDIKMEKDLYRDYEEVTGEVVIFNSRPATYPVNFTVILTRNGEFYRRSVVNVPVFSGSNRLELDTFAKDVFNGPHAVADWQMDISTGGDDPVTASAQWRIVSEDYKAKPEKRSKYIYSPQDEDLPPRPPQKRALDFRKSRPEPRSEP